MKRKRTVKCSGYISIHITKANLFQKKKLFCFSSLAECTLDIPRVNMLGEIGYWMLMRLATVLLEGGLHQGDKMWKLLVGWVVVRKIPLRNWCFNLSPRYVLIFLQINFRWHTCFISCCFIKAFSKNLNETEFLIGEIL